MFEHEIAQYEAVRQQYQQLVAQRMAAHDWMEYNEILFSAHSCAIEDEMQQKRRNSMPMMFF